MAEFTDSDILIGVNDSFSVLHRVHDNQVHGKKTIDQILLETNEKRKWTVLNPGIRMAQSYIYFVFGQEKKLFSKLSEDIEKLLLEKFNFVNNDRQKKKDESDIEATLRHLRNSIAHAKYTFKMLNQSVNHSREIEIVFEDFEYDNKKKEKKYYCRFKINYYEFEYLVEQLGSHAYINAL
ncbi:hypothetical protein ACFSQD_00915 [Flavihumibacter stibioxidans]|uniref:pEK499-p136 HEPN domain-containing protein n=1 Tax=Flavihumibacter stibioxidans TaxID=1834163 RepID=A0ABR7M7T8_9BACT|nr:hypothetical protein [Flavihumibacter stibioxidans]MBC6490686.1 hypothetical protein [Flavihumibacter stibioxidans]